MTKLKLNLIFDIIFSYLIFFVLFYSWINFYKKNIIFSMITALILSIIVIFFIFSFKTKRNNKNNLKLKEKEKIKEDLTKLMFLETQKLVDFFYHTLKEENVKKHKSFLETNLQIIYPFFSQTILNFDALLSILRETIKYKKEIIILCNTAHKDCFSAISNISNIKINIYESEETYLKFFKKRYIIPENIVFSKPKKLSFKELFSYVFNKERTKSFLIMGLILIFSSFFVFYKIYYLIFGSLLLFMALLTRILPYFKKQKREN